MNKKQCEYYADFLLAKARGECVEWKDLIGDWCEWNGEILKARTTYLELRIKPEPLVYWMNKTIGGTVSVYESEALAICEERPEFTYTWIAKRFVGDV